MFNTFDFRVLRENRRVVKDESGNAARQAELENFHRVLMNVSEGKATQRVRDFIVNAYVRGALSTGGQVENVALEGSTAVYTKRRYRDRYNRAIVKRVAKHHNHSLKIKARIRAKGAQGQNCRGPSDFLQVCFHVLTARTTPSIEWFAPI